MFEEAALRYKGSIQLAVVDHITSPSATLLPVKKIASKLRPLGVLVLVDGAHAPGQGKLQKNDTMFLSKIVYDFFAHSQVNHLFIHHFSRKYRPRKYERRLLYRKLA